MTSQTMTIHMPETTYKRARRVASVLQKSVEDVVAGAVDTNLPDLDDVPTEMESELAAMTYLSNEALVAISNAKMDAEHQTQLHEHLDAQGRNELDSDGQVQLTSLMAEYGRTMLRRAKAMALLLERGHSIPSFPS